MVFPIINQIVVNVLNGLTISKKAIDRNTTNQFFAQNMPSVNSEIIRGVKFVVLWTKKCSFGNLVPKNSNE